MIITKRDDDDWNSSNYFDDDEEKYKKNIFRQFVPESLVFFSSASPIKMKKYSA